MARGNQNLALLGYPLLRNLLDHLPTKVARKGFRDALSAAATPIVRAAKAKAPRKSGLLKRAIGKKIKTYTRTNTVVALVGARASISGTFKGRRQVPFRYLHLVEKGTRPHAQGRGQHPGSRAQPFLEDAYQSSKRQAMDIAAARIASTVNREAASMGRK